MTDFFAQSLQAFQERMRTPWIGSILIAFLLWNWQPLLFLLTSDTALRTRFAYFEIHTSWCSLFAGPLIAGFLFAAAKPWISLVIDWLGAKAIHRSRLHADRLAEDRSSKRLDLRAELLQKKDGIANDAINQAIGRKTKIEEAQLNEDEKEQLQQDLDALQSTREEEDVDPIDENQVEATIFRMLSDKSREILRALAQLYDGIGSVINFENKHLEIYAPSRIIDRKSGRTLCNLRFGENIALIDLERRKLVTFQNPDLYEITELGRKVASISENK